MPVYTPVAPSTAGATTLAAGGTPQPLFKAGEITVGAIVQNPPSALESAFYTIDGTAPSTTPGGSVFELAVGQSVAFDPLTTVVSWVAATTGHKLSAWRN